VIIIKLRVASVEFVAMSVSSRAIQQARHSQNAWTRHVECVVSCQDVMSQLEFGLIFYLFEDLLSPKFVQLTPSTQTITSTVSCVIYTV